MTKTRRLATVERETVEHYLARGGRVTRVQASLPNDLVRLSEHQVVDLMMGASYDDLFSDAVTRFNASSDIMSSVQESGSNTKSESEYAYDE